MRSGMASTPCAPSRSATVGQQLGARPQMVVGRVAGERLDPAHPRADAPVRGDDEAPDLAGGAAVRPAAQLEAVVRDPHRPDRLAVLLVEERVRPGVDRVGHGEDAHGHRTILADHAAHLVLDPRAARRR